MAEVGRVRLRGRPRLIWIGGLWQQRDGEGF